MDDIEAHSYEEISTIPAMLIEHTDREVAMVVKEMTDFRNEVRNYVMCGGYVLQ